MKLFNYFISAVLLIIIVSCRSSKTSISEADIKKFDKMVQNKQIRIECNWAYPQSTLAMQQVANSGLLGPGNTAGAISLSGNHNHLAISGDSITSYLPYYGERQMQVSYGGGDSGIEFDGLMKNYKVEKSKDHSYNITFEAKSNSENFNVNIKLFPNLSSNITLNSNSRFSISYSGTVQNETE